jgi:hypothetical protein
MPEFEQFPQPTAKKEISKEQKENIKKIEQLDIGSVPRAEAILVLLELKPATEFATMKWNEKPEKVADTLRQAGISVNVREPNKKEKSEKATGFFTIAKSEQDLKKLMSIDPGKDHVEYGKLMGYPKSAIEAFKTKKTLEFEEAPELENFALKFKLSKTNWQEEIKTLKQWNRALKKYAPDLYKKLRPE